MLSRREMYYGVGYRPHTVQRVALGASRDGRLAAILHDGHQETSTYEEFSEALLNASRFLHSCPNVYTRHRIAPHERAHADLHARSWRGERHLRARIRHGRARGGAEHRSRRAAPAQRAGASTSSRSCRSRAARRETAIGPPPSASAGAGAARAALDARWPLADRLGHGDRHLSDELRAGLGDGPAPAGRHRRGDERCRATWGRAPGPP